MKKILYVTTVSRTINAFLIPHIEELIRKGYKVDCACSIDKEVDKGLIKKGVKVFEIPFNRNPLSSENVKAFKLLDKIQKENNYDIVHVHTPIASIYGRLLKKKHPKIKTIYTAHGYHFLKGGSKIAWLTYYPIEKFMAKFTDVTININEEDYKVTKKLIRPKQSYFVKGVGLDLTKYKPLNNEIKKNIRKELGLTWNDFIIIMIAELNENKNHIQLIKSMEILKNRFPNIKALCVGDGVLSEKLKEEIEKRALGNNVKLLGFRNDINNLINIADIGILLSYREGLPRNIMELMANGKKVIATDIRGNRDLVCNKNVGTLVKLGDYEETAKAIENYYLNNNKNVAIPDEIHPYDVRRVTKEILKIHESVLEG
ncbi:glycosyltransferase [Clostridium tarantellae]|uniref:Glycosyltransferase n=1 Tax=Clostridium tarantellae TaxID=39493 RepID=A0A6I1MJF4_9CLOT|nr:glycosyltransferase [Clostridium tarantellae]